MDRKAIFQPCTIQISSSWIEYNWRIIVQYIKVMLFINCGIDLSYLFHDEFI